MAQTIRNGWLALPTWVRAFVIDAVEGAVVAVVALNVALPHTVAEAQAQALVLIATIGSPVLAAARRHLLPGIVGILRYLFPAPDQTP